MLSQVCLYCSGQSFGDFSLILSTVGQLLSLSLVNIVSFSPLQSPWSSVTQGPFTAPVKTGKSPCQMPVTGVRHSGSHNSTTSTILMLRMSAWCGCDRHGGSGGGSSRGRERQRQRQRQRQGGGCDTHRSQVSGALMFIDEAARNRKTLGRKWGWSLIEKRCIQRQHFVQE
jgi:hypothetical protein